MFKYDTEDAIIRQIAKNNLCKDRYCDIDTNESVGNLFELVLGIITIPTVYF